ncbi:aldo/keto reductase [Motiliproteus sp. SC1-56]|uniref:aldo/keto reductase n=1 Tax=Motiliproteus sp. SC1-56 TaxID=2799565 RepID=UPI001A8EA65E|nr:aldo/keto reductase [Motiliproteus sp. SC1-56]
MKPMRKPVTRRHAVKLMAMGLCAAGLGLPPAARALADPAPTLATGAPLPPIGLGTWISFNVGRDPQLRQARTEVLRAFFEAGGGMVDCSPMYGSSAKVLGHALAQLGTPESLFSAEKVWTRDGGATGAQIATQASAWNIKRFDLVQVHNLLAWQPHLEALREMKAAGQIRYLGVTTSHGRRHRELETIMAREPLDFVQLTYNLTHREAERRLLPLAAEKGIAVIANRPYDGGRLISRLKNRGPVPNWATDAFGCRTWADFLLRFIIAHPAITCAIPATSQVEHMRENMAAGAGPMPDAATRQRMIRFIESL